MAIRFVSASGKQATFEWDAVDGATYLARIQRGTSVVGSYMGSATRTTFRNLVNGQAYRVNYWTIISGQYSFEGGLDYTHSTAPDPPSSPTRLRVSGISESTITLNWTKSSGATAYKVRAGTTGSFTTLGDVSSYEFTGLSANTQYTLQVVASNDGGDSSPAQIMASTNNVEPPPPPPPPPPKPKPISPKMPIPMRYVVVKADDSEQDISRQVSRATLKNGIELNDEFAPYAKSQGEIMLNDWREQYSDKAFWESVNIYAGTVLIFVCSITGIQERGDQGKTTIYIELLGAANLPSTVVRVSTGASDQKFETFMAGSGLPLTRPPNVTFPNLYVAAGVGYDGPFDVERQGGSYQVTHRFAEGGGRLMEDLLTFGTMFAFERPTANAFRLYPVRNLGNDSRRASASASIGADTLVRREDFSLLGEDWFYDGQTFNTANSAVVGQTQQFDDTVTFTRHWDGQSWDWNPARAFSAAKYANFLEVTGVRFTSISGASFNSIDLAAMNRNVTFGSWGARSHRDHNRVRDPDGVTVRFQYIINYNERRAGGVTIEQEHFTAAGVQTPRRKLGTSGLPIPRSGANNTASEAAIQALLDFLEDYSTDVIKATQLLPQDGDMAALQVECGDIVNVNKGDARDRCLLVGIDYFHEGLRPIQLKWTCLSLGTIPTAGGQPPPPDPRIVRFQGDAVMLAMEDVYFG